MRKRYQIILLIFLLHFIGVNGFAAINGSIIGFVRDGVTGEALPGANINLLGTALGSASDLKGEYRIYRVPPGTYTLRVTFIGYITREFKVLVQPDQSLELNIELEYDVIEGETVTITAQAEGQVAAINQQLRSNTISNVVSAERIQELPDANAAESVGRLPGISIKRDGGEGNKIVIRGLAPAYNMITIAGEKVPATDLDDRSVDLNMISPEILAGIEVIKALTPDKDADAFGGIVDFKLTVAPSGGFRSKFRFQGGYNAQRAEAGQYKASSTVSNRYWDEMLGIMVTGNIERAQRGSDQFSAGYTVPREKREGELSAPISVTDVSLDYLEEVRKRLGFSLLMDYILPNGKLMFNNFISRLDRNELIWKNRFTEDSNTHELRFQDRIRQIDVLSNSFSGEHNLFLGNLDWRLSRTSSLTRHPFDSLFRFRERSAFDQSKLTNFFGPDVLIGAAYNDLENTSSYQGEFYTEKAFERDMAAQINLKIPYTLNRKIAGYLKFGGKYTDKLKNRDRGLTVRRLDNSNFDYALHHSQYGQPGFTFQQLPTGWPSVFNYLDSDFETENFLGGEYEFGPRLNRNELNYLLKTFLLDSVYRTSSLANLDDYEVNEKISAGYIMSEINLGRFLMFLPGVRFEQTTADLTGRKGTIPDEFYESELNKQFISDTTTTVTYGRWFPMFHARVRPTDWFDIRLAYTKTLSRPRLDWMLPKKKVYGVEQTVDYGRPDLIPQISTNYDAFVSIYSNKIGLLTLGGFYKEIDDLIFNRIGHKILNAAKEGFPKELQGFKLNRPENNPYITQISGMEIEWQTNFRWLPKPLDGFILNVNYTHLWSKTNFPRSFVKQDKIPVFPFVKTSVIDTFRVGDMLDQADDIANIAIGYDKSFFSARLSILYQGKTLTAVGERPELDGFTSDLLRMDLSLKFSLNQRLGLFFNWNNINNEPDESFQLVTRYPTNREFYGWTMDAGIGYEF